MATQYYTAASLDGFIATPDHSLDWLFQFDTGGGTGYDAFIRGVGALAMGSHTFEWLQRHLERTEETWPYEQPAWVFTSRRLAAIDGADIRFMHGDVAPVHAQMQEAAGRRNVWIVGGGELAGQFHDAGLLDELIVTIAPVTLGEGAPLLPRLITHPPLAWAGTRQFGELLQMRFRVPAPR